ncbi:MAG: MATE family efflux transporter [Candidatus Nanohaloarchaea archaeon]
MFLEYFKSREQLDLTGGDISSNLFYLSLPIVVINLLRTAYNITDTFWVGQLSADALAAITFAFPLIFFLISLGMGIAVAGSVLVAQFEGSGRRKMVNYAASQTMVFTFLASLAIGAFGYFFISPIIGLLGASESVLPLATGYMEIISIGLFAMFGFNVFISVMRGFGDTLTPMLLMLGAVVLNIILDPFLIFGWWFFPAMGVEGAAVATIFCRGLALLAGLAIMFSGVKGVKISFSRMVPEPGFLVKMLRIGVPATVESTGRSISVNALVAIVGIFATPVVAGFGIGIRIFSLVFLPATAVGRGVETMTGQNLGAGRFDRAEETNWLAAKVMFVLLSLVGVVAFLAAGPIAFVFTTSAEVAKVGGDFIRIVALSFGFLGATKAFTGGFRGAGKTAVAAIISIAALGFIRLPIAFFASKSLGPTGIWAAFPVSNVLGAVIAVAWFSRGTWKQRVDDGENSGVLDYLLEAGFELVGSLRSRLPFLDR